MLLLVPTIAMSQAGGAYRLSSYTIASGGGSASGGLLALLASAGQPVAGQAAAGAYSLTAGFWDPRPAGSVGIDEIAGAPLPLAIRLGTPNPTAGPSTIVLDLPAVHRLALSVYNVSGRLVRSLESAPLPPGQHRLAWDGRDEAG
ncbi:MAG TPA: FlgD immunoglobulin-like domain containing protein, partial [Solirubrobacterales bacterium]|nr:FlgD immunoglobulin-like domain containing protein [Solirubrobacterales bacterium]